MAETELKNEKENMSKSEFKYEVRNEILKQGGGFADLLFITDEIIENAEIKNYSDHRKGYRYSDADRKSDHHRRFADGSSRDLFNLFVEDVDCGLCKNDDRSEDKPENSYDPRRIFRKLCAHFVAYWHKAAVNRRQKDNEPDDRVRYADDYLNEFFSRQFEEYDLKNEEKRRYQPNRYQYFFRNGAERGEKIFPEMRFYRIIGELI